jgi:uncharacterized membrane protein YdbT with pleckstrin-like domain
MPSKGVILKAETVEGAKTILNFGLLLYCLYVVVEIKSKKYRINTQSLDQAEGVLSRSYNSIHMTHVLDFDLHESLWQRLLGLSTIKVVSKDKSTPELFMRNISHDAAVKAYDFLRVNSVNSMVGELVRRRTSKS